MHKQAAVRPQRCTERMKPRREHYMFTALTDKAGAFATYGGMTRHSRPRVPMSGPTHAKLAIGHSLSVCTRAIDRWAGATGRQDNSLRSHRCAVAALPDDHRRQASLALSSLGFPALIA